MTHGDSRHGIRGRRAARGQALTEMALVVVAMTFLLMGIVEVGWAFSRTNMLVHALRDGARFGATLDDRDPDGCLTGTGTSQIQTHVNDVLSSLGVTATVTVDQDCDGEVPTITVNAAGDVQLLFNIMGPTFSVDRSVTFADEGGRICPDVTC